MRAGPRGRGDAGLSRRALLEGALATCLGGAGCAPPEGLSLRGAGATLPYPLYARWIALHARVAPRVHLDYQGVGSASGLRQVQLGMADFAATDAPLRATLLDVLHIPTAVVAVALAHDLPGLTGLSPLGSPLGLRLGPRLLAGIFEGRVRSWRDAAVAADNPGLGLPDLPIVPVHRSDGSGATMIFSEWLARTAARDGRTLAIAPGMLARFPSGVGARGNDGVARVVARLPGAIGYVEVAHARRADLVTAAVSEREGEGGAAPEPAAIAAAASEVADALDVQARRQEVSPGAYPLTTFTYLVVPREIPDRGRAAALARFVHWILGPGQAECERLGYQPLPPALAARARELVARDLLSSGSPALRVD